MSDYGVQSTGYVRKPIAVILAELEAAMVTEFGPGVIQTPQSPFGQLNGLMADLVAEVDERNLDIYQSYDPDQAESTRLDILGKLRLIKRGDDNDVEFRKAISNEGQARVDVQDLARAIAGLDGVTYSKVFVNETGETTNFGLERGSVSIAVVGGDDEEIALAIRKYVVPGINTYGNYPVTSIVSGFCRSMSIIRPVDVSVDLTVRVRTLPDKFDCPPPSAVSIAQVIDAGWLLERINGLNPSFYTIRSIVERAFTNVEVLEVFGERDDVIYSPNQPIPIGFTEMATVISTVTIE